MKWWWALLVCASTLVSVQEVAGSRILLISAIASKSHKGFFTAVANELADNGHQVTIVSPYKPSKTIENVREIVLDDMAITQILPNLFDGGALAGPMELFQKIPSLCSEGVSRRNVQDLLHEEFDLGMITIFLADCFIPLFHQLKVPFVYISPAGLLGPLNQLIGNPDFPSFINSPFTHSFHPFTFPERLMNTLIETAGVLGTELFLVPSMEAECRRRGFCPEGMPRLAELRANASAIFVNSVRSMESPPRPVVPSVVHIGGIHCRESKPLPQDLEEWVAGAGDDGFIFFSLGSVVQPSSMPEEYRKTLVKTFGSLKQRVLWKWNEETMEDLPPNVRLGKWLPQQDILGDSRLRVFITHGGALSTQESMYHGTPVIGLPVFADQMTNMMEVQNQGWGRVLKWQEMTPQMLEDTILFVMKDEKLRAEVKRRSALMRDQPMDPSQVANYWTEYIIRHNGAPHLRSPILSMTWYQVYNIDVWLTVIGVVSVVLGLLLKLLVVVCRRLCSSKPKAKRD